MAYAEKTSVPVDRLFAFLILAPFWIAVLFWAGVLYAGLWAIDGVEWAFSKLRT